MTMDKVFQLRIDDEHYNKLSQLYEYYRVPSMSALIRLLIQFAHEETGYLDYWIEGRRK